MNPYIHTWNDVVDALSSQPWRSIVRLRKGVLPHPLAFGMAESMGLQVGQSADYRLVLDTGAGLHVRDYETHYEAHLDEVHPDVSLYEHLRRDAPQTFVAGGAALGVVIGGALGRNAGSALVGGLLGGLIAALATPAE